MKKFFRRLLFLVLIVFVLSIALSIIITSLFGNKIGNRLVEEINKQITSELTVERFDLSLISGFPNISANLHNVVLTDTREQPFVELETLSFRLGLFSLLRSKVDVKSIVLQGGQVIVTIDESGKANYSIYQNDAKQPDSGAQQEININKAILKDVDVEFTDKNNNQEAKFWIDEASLSGNFTDASYTLKSDADILNRYFQIGGDRYLAGKSMLYDASLKIEQKEEITAITLEEAALTLGKNTFNVTGNVEQKGEEAYLDLRFVNDGGDLASLIKLLSKEQLDGFEDLESNGNFNFEATIKGLASAGRQPAIQAVMKLDRGRIDAPQMGKPFKDVSLNATFTNGPRQNNQTSVLEVEGLSGYFGRDRLDAKLKVENFDNPVLRFSMNGILPIDAVYSLSGNPKIKGGSGEVTVKNLKLDGNYNDLITPSRIGRVKAGGTLSFDKAALEIMNEQLTLHSGDFHLEDNFLAIQNILFEGAGSHITFDGSAYNVLPVLFADSVNSKRAELEFKAVLKAKSIDFDRLLALSMVDEEEIDASTQKIDSIKQATIKKRERVTNFLRGTFEAAIEEYNYNKIAGKSFSGQIEFINNEMTIRGVTEAMDGQFKLDGEMYFEDEPRLEAKLDCKNIDINKFFSQTENFGQDILTAKNVEGQLNAKIAIDAYWDESGYLLDDKLRVLAGIGLQEGSLEDFSMLKQFSSFVNVKDLMNIKFTNLRNFLEYRRNKLYIPAMFIQSNAMNLTISGEHSYNNEMKYSIKVNASQVLANRFTRHDPSLKPLKARKQGFLNLYYTINGTVDDYEINSSKRGVKSDFELSNLRKREIQLALEEKFGVVELVEEPVEWRDIPEYSGDVESDEDVFIDWEEEVADTTGRN